MLNDTITQLRHYKNQVLAEIKRLEHEVASVTSALQALSAVPESGAAPAETVSRHRISAAGIARIRAGQKARWAKAHSQQAGTAPATMAAGRPKISAAGIARIRNAQKLRWAKFRAAKANQ